MILKKHILKLQHCCRDVPCRVSTVAIILFLLISNSATAQNSTDFGGMITAEYQHSFGRFWDVNVKEDLRFDNDFSQYSRSKTSFGLDYKLKKYRLLEGLKMGVAFDYINKYTGKHLYRNRYRFSAHFTYKYDYRNWEFSFRTRYQMMMHDETTGYYNYKMQHAWRNRLSVEYHERNSRWSYGVSGELIAENKDKDLFLESILLVGNVDYRLTRRQYLSVFVRDYRDIYIESDQIRTVYFGLGWKFKH